MNLEDLSFVQNILSFTLCLIHIQITNHYLLNIAQYDVTGDVFDVQNISLSEKKF
jgi:hypothetical protein